MQAGQETAVNSAPILNFGTIRDDLVNALRHNAILISVTLAYAITCYTILQVSFPEEERYLLTDIALYSTIHLSTLFSVAIYYTAYLVIKHRPKSPLRFAWNDISTNYLSNTSIINMAIGYFMLVLTMPFFINMKTAIPEFIPFAYDETFRNWDLALHFGVQPWEIVQHLVPHKYVTLVLHQLYYVWFPVVFTAFCWQCCATRDKVLRMQFLLSFLGCWMIVGTLFATFMSSAGPIFYPDLFPDMADPYQTGAEYLAAIHQQHNLVMFEVKETLWQSYVADAANAVRGISAMPSMHVSLAFLLLLFGWKKGPLLRWFSTVYFILIFLGSIHLLWHYAVDGYVSIILTAVIWWVSGLVARLSS